MNTITVLLCDDHPMVREGLRALIETEEVIERVGEVGDGRQAVRAAKRLLPDVALVDLSMPVLNGVEAARQIAQEAPSVKVLILSAYADDEQPVQRALEAGAAGYLTKGTSTDLLPAIRRISEEETFIRPTNEFKKGQSYETQQKPRQRQKCRPRTGAGSL